MNRIFGVYLAIHFAMLLPYGVELFSSRGVLPHTPFVTLFPDAPACVIALLIVGILASLVFADIGVQVRRQAAAVQRIAALMIWYILAALFCRNPLIGNPSLPFVGFILLTHAFLDDRERTCAAWIVTAIAYSYSGWTKLAGPSWIDGTAIVHVLTNPLARTTPLRLLLLGLPSPMLHAMTWAALALELLYAPLALSHRARPVIWTLMLLMHIGLLVTIDFADLSFAMIVVQMYTFDPTWLKMLFGDRKRIRERRKQLAVDAA